jgi:hypothetical protein
MGGGQLCHSPGVGLQDTMERIRLQAAAHTALSQAAAAAAALAALSPSAA